MLWPVELIDKHMEDRNQQLGWFTLGNTTIRFHVTGFTSPSSLLSLPGLSILLISVSDSITHMRKRFVIFWQVRQMKRKKRRPQKRTRGGKWGDEKSRKEGLVCLNFPLKESAAAAQKNRDGWTDKVKRWRWVNTSLSNSDAPTSSIQNQWKLLE